MSSGRIAGSVLIGSALIVGVAGVALLGLFFSLESITPAAFGLGVFLLIIVVLPLLGAGLFLLVKSARESRDEAIIAKQRRILDAVATRGQVRISDLVLELKATREQVQNWVYNLVGMGLFSGYVDWDDGLLYSMQASQLRELSECKKCGGKVSLVGKGVTKCQYCGAEYFL